MTSSRYRTVVSDAAFILACIIIAQCLLTLAWALTYRFDPTGEKPNHCCVEMCDEVGSVFDRLNIPHKKVLGMSEVNEDGYYLCHEWIMIETPWGELPFESTALLPVFFNKDYFFYDTVVSE